ncbi:hypothetical protein [Aminivibrio sp.]|uniref:hypothetical protein n=2 Tax=Aminivibrio sp. TaxID=1872489 RepID=UPI0016B9D2D5|nr:hypothetical protein [Synergistaceae bacterium]NCC57865.1 hypothetical protein [Synergistales bacterium]MDD3390094.1 hypothetical protein [Synergistaceae bacterium]MDD4020602.1 hypothetical protein [Synergistaceae bacterium]MDD4611402.1 hypothetical protein [Synergistaceae bacterium]
MRQGAENIAPDMGRLVILLPADSIVYFSWIISEYDGLGFVKTEKILQKEKRERDECRNFQGGEEETDGIVSLFFPEERRENVLELLSALKAEGMSVCIIREERAGSSSPHKNDEQPEEIISI